jgi:hypothetical protein
MVVPTTTLSQAPNASYVACFDDFVCFLTVNAKIFFDSDIEGNTYLCTVSKIAWKSYYIVLI